MNPSTYELLAGIHAVPAEEVVVLPNSAERDHAGRARRRALGEAGRRRAVAQPADRARGARRATRRRARRSENAAAIARRWRACAAARSRPAARDDADGRFSVGEAIGFVDESLVAWGEPEATLAQVLATLGDGSELITCIAGAGAPLSAERIAALAPDEVEVEHRDGGQPSYWWLLAAE